MKEEGLSDVYTVVGCGIEEWVGGGNGEEGEGEGMGVDCVVCVQVSGGFLYISLFLLFLFRFPWLISGGGRRDGRDELY